MVKKEKLTSGLVGYVVNKDDPQILMTYHKSKFYQFDRSTNKNLRSDELAKKAEELEDSTVSEAVSYAILDLIALEKKQSSKSSEIKGQLEKKLQPCLDTNDKTVADLIRNELNELLPKVNSKSPKNKAHGSR